MEISSTTGHKTAGPQEPMGINHLVLQVQDMQASHKFYTEILGFKHVGTSKSSSPGTPPMRFYSGVKEGKLHHHDFALLQVRKTDGDATEAVQSMNHVAFEYSTKDAFYLQLDYLKSKGVKLRRLVERGTTHSAELLDPDGIAIELVWELPRNEWEENIDDALNRRTERAVDVA